MSSRIRAKDLVVDGNGRIGVLNPRAPGAGPGETAVMFGDSSIRDLPEFVPSECLKQFDLIRWCDEALRLSRGLAHVEGLISREMEEVRRIAKLANVLFVVHAGAVEYAEAALNEAEDEDEDGEEVEDEDVEEVDDGPDDEPDRIRIVAPSKIRNGCHGAVIFYSDTVPECERVLRETAHELGSLFNQETPA